MHERGRFDDDVEVDICGGTLATSRIGARAEGSCREQMQEAWSARTSCMARRGVGFGIHDDHALWVAQQRHELVEAARVATAFAATAVPTSGLLFDV